ncbi:MAG: DNA-protecting protein DprA [Acidobacteria bacterium]|nr:DNA-protecting protein DprA [Acidobacteriota bacterium]
MTAAAPVRSILSREDELHWLALRLIPGLGTRRSVELVRHFRSATAVFRASEGALDGAGVSGSLARSIASGCTFDDAVSQQEKLAASGTVLIPFLDPIFPQALREIFDPPLVLFARGRLELLESVMIAVVGTRRPSAYGQAATSRLSEDLAKAGVTIVSGMARGIDTTAHQAALKAKGATIAVFGCGADMIYPAENRKLAAQIAAEGLLLSEFPMGTPAYPQNFPIRNRIVSGMSSGVLVVEGAQYSGSAITARLALDQGRDVFAVPGNITSKMSWGPNLLIKQGCKLVQDWQDVVNELPDTLRRRLADSRPQKMLELLENQPSGEVSAGVVVAGAPVTRAILGQLRFDNALHLDELMESLEGFSSSEIIAALFDLELEGLVRQLPGKNFVKVWVD